MVCDFWWLHGGTSSFGHRNVLPTPLRPPTRTRRPMEKHPFVDLIKQNAHDYSPTTVVHPATAIVYPPIAVGYPPAVGGNRRRLPPNGVPSGIPVPPAEKQTWIPAHDPDHGSVASELGTNGQIPLENLVQTSQVVAQE